MRNPFRPGSHRAIYLWRLRNMLRWHFIRDYIAAEAARHLAYFFGFIIPIGDLYIRVLRADGRIEDLGLVSRRVVTTAFVNLLVDDLQASQAAFHTMKYHAMGTNNTAEAVGDTALGTEVETRGVGTQVEGATANIYKSVGTVTATAARAVVEHGLLSAAAAGTLMDRSVFAVINLAINDNIQFTYQLTANAGG